MAPTPPHLIYFTKGGAVKGFGAAQGLRCRQTYFFPVPRSFAFSRSRCHRANQATVGLGYHILRSRLRPDSERFRVFLLKQLFGPACILQRRLSHRARVDLKTVMFQHSIRRMPEGMLATEIG